MQMSRARVIAGLTWLPVLAGGILAAYGSLVAGGFVWTTGIALQIFMTFRLRQLWMREHGSSGTLAR